MMTVPVFDEPPVDDNNRLNRVTRLGLDETAFLAATAHRWTSYVTGTLARSVVAQAGTVVAELDVGVNRCAGSRWRRRG